MPAVPKPSPTPRKPVRWLQRSTRPIKAKKRKPSEFARIYGSRKRVRWMKSQPCVFCAGLSPFFSRTDGSSHNAHTEHDGMGRKGSYLGIIPLCPTHHKRYDERLAPPHLPTIRKALANCAPKIERRWLAYEELCKPD